MTRTPPLTHQVHRRLAGILRPGDIAIDATAGNGHDTLFLAQQVGETGQVFACDIQHAAIEATRARLEAHQMLERVTLVHRGHEHLTEILPRDLHGRVAAILFNLGYLPGADKHCITRPDTTLQALDGAATLPRSDGVISVIAYPGHAGGEVESQGVMEWFENLAPRNWRWDTRHSATPTANSPFALWASKGGST